jgi:cellulose synthase/poly-beta-1,6-N-acetylglucosamine synthase-like glycosyltransferase
VPSDFNEVSVVIAAKNEEQNIPFLVKALSQQNYPADKYEVLIIDDNSDDNTYCLARELTCGNPVFSVYKPENKKYAGKKGALDFGISKAKYENILITDADCQPGKEWIKSFAGRFADGYDFLFGHAPFIMGKSFINRVSCFENLRSSVLTFSAASAGFPYSAAARSFGFRKSSFEKIGGYKNTTGILGGDDDLLLREAIKHKMKIGTVYDKNAFVYSCPKNDLRSYLRQKSRHTKTSVHYLPSRQIMLALWHIVNLVSLVSPVLSIFYPGFIYLFLTKVITDFFVVSAFSRKFGYNFTGTERIYLQLIYEFFIVINFLNSIVKKDEW